MIEGVLIPFVEPPRQSKVLSQTFQNQLERHAIEQEITEMLQKGAIQVVFPPERGIYNYSFLSQKKDGGTDL